MRTRHAIRHHGFITRFHRPVAGSTRKKPRKHLLPRTHVPHRRSAHAGQVIAKKAKAVARVRASKGRTAPKLSHTKVAGGHHVAVHHRVAGVHSTGPRKVSAATRAKISQSLRGKHHPHRGHAMSAATRAKISAATSKRLKGRPHPHKGHVMSNTARAKISKALTGKRHPHRSSTRKKK
jgi:hypothetical protein